ncbi:MAG: hypothetical protein R2932_51185 [Caldilineaceae bacterium]
MISFFFGWFREVQKVGRGYRFVRHAPDQHVIYGWLQVGEIWQGPQLSERLPAWAGSHPHCTGGRGVRNTIYVAADQLTLPGQVLPPLPGAGCFAGYDERYCLTAPQALRTQWRLPRWFYPNRARAPLTYHGDPMRWAVDERYAYLRSATRGQEFVLDSAAYPEALPWLHNLVSTTTGR